MQPLKTPCNERQCVGGTDFVYIVAPSGAGKTFIGDYLSVEHGFHHVDGDIPLKKAHLPQYKSIGPRYWDDRQHWRKGRDGPKELWQPYFDELARLTLDAATNGSKKVVLSHATYRHTYQKYLVSKLFEAGVPKENLTVLTLTIDVDTRSKGLFYRMERLLPLGMTRGDFLRATIGWNGKGDIDLDEYVRICRREDDPFQIPSDGLLVDVTTRGELSTLDAVDMALNLGERNHPTATMKEIEERIKPIDIARDKDFIDNLDWFETTADDEETTFVEEARRRSSLIEIHGP